MNALKSFVGVRQVSPEKTQLTGKTKPITFRHRKLKIVACKYSPLRITDDCHTEIPTRDERAVFTGDDFADKLPHRILISTNKHSIFFILHYLCKCRGQKRLMRRLLCLDDKLPHHIPIFTNKHSIFFILHYLCKCRGQKRIRDIEGAKKLHEEWLFVKTSYDARIGNLLLSWHVKNGNIDKALDFFKHMREVGRKPNSSTWEILAKIYQDEIDTVSSQVLTELQRQSGIHNDKVYASLIVLSVIAENNSDNENTDDVFQTLLNQLKDNL
ncbi:hypothetical protein K1719_034746 [Acacia pycnantha]|nr:hypothetical protein K1719_034746 [Acacia pycnantha]